MKRFVSSIEWLGIGLLVVFGAGCVDQEASISLRGLIQLQGQASTEEVTCGSGDNASTRERPVLSCETEIQPGSAQNFLGNLKLNIQEFENRGQLGPPFEALSNVDFCTSSRQEYVDQLFRHSPFVTAFDSVNNLEDSTNVGAESGGGGGQGGFEGLRLNTNSLQLNKIVVRFPNVSGTSSGRLKLDKDIQTAGLLESNGGALAMTFQLFKREEVPSLKRLHQKLVLQRTNLTQYNERAQRTTITVLARIWLEGETVSETSVESNRLEIPINICNRGCDMTPSCQFSRQQN